MIENFHKFIDAIIAHENRFNDLKIKDNKLRAVKLVQDVLDFSYSQRERLFSIVVKSNNKFIVKAFKFTIFTTENYEIDRCECLTSIDAKKLMLSHTREVRHVIVCGESAAGKVNFKKKCIDKFYKHEISFTTRQMRDCEINGVDYYFVTVEEFEKRIEDNFFLQFDKLGESDGTFDYYGTSYFEFLQSEVMIMTPQGIVKIPQNIKERCLIVYVTADIQTRLYRMKKRGTSNEKILERINIDNKQFKDFKDYDTKIDTSGLGNPKEIYFDRSDETVRLLKAATQNSNEFD